MGSSYLELWPKVLSSRDDSLKRMMEPQPEWTLEELKKELNDIPVTAKPQHFRRPSPIHPAKQFSWQELSTAADFGREKRAFRICAFDSDSEESEDSDGDEEEPLQQKSSPVFSFTKATLSSAEKKDMYPKFAEERVLHRTEGLEQSLFELDRARMLKVQEEIRMRRLSFEAAFQDEALRSAAALEQVENERELKHELAKRTDKQYQRSIAEARDLHLSALQRDHEQRSQVEERKIKKEVAIEEARKREVIAREERERQEKARLEAEAKRKADALLAEKAAVESARRKQAEAALQRAEADKRAREEAELKARESVASVAVKPLQFQSLSANSDGPKPKIAESAARLESARSQLFKTWQQACPDLSSNAVLKKEFKGWERRIIKILQQVSVSQDQIRMKSMELLEIFRDPTINQPFVFTMFSSKLMSQCELQVAKLPSYAFALAQVVVNVSSQVPDVMVAVLAKLHEICIFTVPKYYSYKKDDFEDDSMYYKMLGYIESDGRLESTDEYIARMKAYVTFYAAVTQADALNGQNPHGLKEAWAWCARLLNTIPANRLSAIALEAFLKVAGYRLYRVYSKAFIKMLQAIVSHFIENLKKHKENEQEMRAVVIQLETYLHTRQYLQEPDGHNIPTSDLSSTKKA